MTAIPKMTGTQALSTFHFKLTVFLQLSFLVSLILNLENFSKLLGVLIFVNLFSFFGTRRIAMRGRVLPSGFIFVPLSLLCGLLGFIFMSWPEFFGNTIYSLGKSLLYEGFILNLIIGVGSRLIPFLSRKVRAVSPLEVKFAGPIVIYFQALVFNLSFLLEILNSPRLAYFTRFLIFVFVLIRNFKFFEKMVHWALTI
jgi:hypothetical protein